MCKSARNFVEIHAYNADDTLLSERHYRCQRINGSYRWLLWCTHGDL